MTLQARPQSSYHDVVGKVCNPTRSRYEVEFIQAEGYMFAIEPDKIQPALSSRPWRQVR